MKPEHLKTYSLKEKESLIIDEIMYFVEKLEIKYNVTIDYNVDDVANVK